MKILSVHNSYLFRGGEDESCELEENILLENGHRVVRYHEHNERIANLSKVYLALNSIWSQKSYSNVTQILTKDSFDVVQVQNFFPLISPSVYYAASDGGIPVVQTLRNYRLLCPNGLFFRNGHVCEDCLGKPVPWPSILHACYKNDRAASTATATMLTLHNFFNTWSRMVDVYVVLSQFAKNKFIAGGIPEQKIVVKPNFIHPDPGCGTGQGGFGVFVGRLSPEKGLHTLLDAWKEFNISYPLKIIGDGPLEFKIHQLSKTLPNIELLGRKSNEEVLQLIGEASFLVFPSLWYETFGRVAIEAFAKSTPVIAAKIGAIAELIEHQKNGLLFNPGDSEDLASKVLWAIEHPGELRKMRQEARNEYETKYTSEINYEQLLSIYSSARKKN